MARMDVLTELGNVIIGHDLGLDPKKLREALDKIEAAQEKEWEEERRIHWADSAPMS